MTHEKIKYCEPLNLDEPKLLFILYKYIYFLLKNCLIMSIWALANSELAPPRIWKGKKGDKCENRGGNWENNAFYSPNF